MFALKVQYTSPRLSLLQVNKKTVWQSQRYRKLWGSIIQTITGCGVIPSIVWGGLIYFQFSASYTAKITDNMKTRAKNRRDSSDPFLNERTAQLFSLTSPSTLEQLQNEDPSAEWVEPCIWYICARPGIGPEPA